MVLGSGIRDLGSGIRKNLFRIPDPGVKKAPDPRSATLLPGAAQASLVYTRPGAVQVPAA